MTTAQTIADFLEADLARAWVAGVVEPGQVYQGQATRSLPTPIDVRVAFQRRPALAAKTGQARRHSFQIVVGSNGMDDTSERKLSQPLSDLADEIVERYNGRSGGLTSVLRAGLPAIRFERAQASRGEVTGIGQSREWRQVAVTLDIDTWE